MAALAIAVVIIVAGFAIYYSIENKGSPQGKTVLTIYTYPSFLAYGSNYTQAYSVVFGTFAKQHNVTINLVNESAGLYQTLKNNKGHESADIVIGLTNMHGVQAASEGLLAKYTPPGAKSLNASLIKDMGSAAPYITPYEYSYLGIDYNRSFVNSTGFAPGGHFTPSFLNLSSRTLAENLLLENPTTDDTGQAFLLWEIAYYTYVLHENWTKWWNDTKQYTHTYSSWDSAFGQFESGSNTSLLVSYLTDPAYNVYNGYGNGTGSVVSYHNSQAYGWRTIYGIGIVNGSSKMQLDRQFVNYFMNQTVQSQLPLNEWMYPANQSTEIPHVYSVLPPQTDIYPLNNYINATVISENLQTWDTEWQSLQ